VFEGVGRNEFLDGSIYIGQFSEHSANGKGIRTYTDGRVEKGLWKDNEFLVAWNFKEFDFF